MSEATPKRSNQARPPHVGYAATWVSNLGHGLPNDLLDQALLRLTRLAAFMAVLMTVSITGHAIRNYISGFPFPALTLGGGALGCWPLR